MKLDGQVAIVTGGAQGIGAAIAERLSENGARVAIADLQSDGALANRLTAAGHTAMSTHLDVADEDSVRQAFDTVERELGPVDILVNNAGIGTPVALLVDTTTEAWERTFRINLTGSMMCTREAFRRMIARGKGGNVLNIASNVAKRGVPLRSAYASSKWAMLGLTETAALEGAPHGIQVNALLPGNVQTPHLTEVVKLHADAEGKTVEEYTEMLKGLSPMNRYVELDEIADVALFLTSSASSAMTGQSVNVTAGWIMH